MRSFWGEDYMVFPSAEEYLAYLKGIFLKMEIFQINKDTMRKLSDSLGSDRVIKRLASEYGWPSVDFHWQKFSNALTAEV